MTLPSLFDPEAVYTPQAPIMDMADARRRRDKAIDTVEAAADSSWKEAADYAIRKVAATRTEFTTDDIWQVLHDMSIEAPREPRALGASMRRAAAAGVIEPTNRIERSARPVCHAAPKRVWRSRVADNS